MNEFTKSIFNLRELEEYAGSNNYINQVHPGLKWLITIIYIVALASVDKYDIGRIMLFGVYPLVVFFLTDIKVKTFLSKLVIPVILSVSLGLFNPFFDRQILFEIGGVSIGGGFVSLLTLVLRGTFSISATLLLVASSGIEGLGQGLASLKIPKVLIMLLFLMYRYIGVLLDEISITMDAYRLRSGTTKGIHVSTWGSLVGQIAIRSYYRANDIYHAMELRGYNHD